MSDEEVPGDEAAWILKVEELEATGVACDKLESSTRLSCVGRAREADGETSETDEDRFIATDWVGVVVLLITEARVVLETVNAEATEELEVVELSDDWLDMSIRLSGIEIAGEVVAEILASISLEVVLTLDCVLELTAMNV